MCLIKKSIFPRFTLKDKIVYKIVYKSNILGTVYRTPYQYQVIIFNKEYKGEWFYDGLLETLFCSKITEGYIHSIKTLKDAIRYTRDHLFSPAYILKAVIPKHTLYWEGVDNDIASRKIKYIDEICEINGNRTKIYPCGMA